MIIVDILIIALLAYAAFLGSKRGGLLVALELISFILATVVAYFVYQPLGLLFKSFFGVSLALANVSAFLIMWISIELLSAVLVRYLIIRPHKELFRENLFSKIAGGILNCIKILILVVVGLNLYASLPISSNMKQPITNSYISKGLLQPTVALQRFFSGTLGKDISDSLNLFTVTTSTESEKRVYLGFTTKTGVIDEADEKKMLNLINNERTSRGLETLSFNSKATQVAREYSKQMLAEGLFSHIDSSGHTPFDRMKAGGVEFGSAGENLALAPTLSLAHQGLMNSPGHKANILSKDYKTVGIGIIDAGVYGLMVTQNFTD